VIITMLGGSATAGGGEGWALTLADARPASPAVAMMAAVSRERRRVLTLAM
jgi:hypothetical protein